MLIYIIRFLLLVALLNLWEGTKKVHGSTNMMVMAGLSLAVFIALIFI